MARVVMLVHEKDGVFGASFPDFPGATTVANDLDPLISKAGEMLVFHVDGMVAGGEPVPLIRAPSQIVTSPELAADREGAVLRLLEVDLPGKTVRVSPSRRKC